MANNSDNQSLTLDQFLIIPLEFIRINCEDYIQNFIGSNVYSVELLVHYPDISISNSYKSYRNFSEYKDLFENFTKNNPDEKLEEFPFRYTFGKASEENRINYFHKLLNKILDLSRENNKKEDNFSLLYNFIFRTNEVSINKLTKEKLKKFFNKDSEDEINSEEEEDKKSVKSDIINNINHKPSQKLDKRLNKTYSTDKLTTYNNSSLFEDDKNSSNSNSINNNDDIKSIDNNINFESLRRNTINFFNQKINSVFNNKDSIINGIKKTITNEEKNNTSKEKNILDNIYVKTSLKDYCLHTIKLKERCLLLYNKEFNNLDDKEEKIIIENNKDNDDDYYLIIPLYKINIEIFRLIYEPEDKDKKSEKNNLKFLKEKKISSSEIYEFELYAPNSLLYDVNSEIVIRLYHDYNRFETFIKFDCNWRIKAVKHFLSKIEQASYSAKDNSLFIDEVTESYMDSFGSIMVDVIKFNAPYYEGKIKLKVNLDPYTMPTKTIISSEGEYNYNQKFLLPLHNRFKYLKFFIYKKKEEGYIYKKEAEKLIATCEIPLPKLINIYFLDKNPIKMKLKPIKEKSKKKQKYSNMTIEFKVIDYSSLLSLLVKNTNKRVLDDYPLYNKEGDSEEPYSTNTLLKRIKRVLAMFKDIYSFYKMLQNFKYPILSSSFLLLVIFYTFFCDPKYILTHIIIFLIQILIFYSSVFHSYIYPKISYYFLYYRNKYDTPSKIAITISQKKKEEVAQSDYLIKKKGFSFRALMEFKDLRHTYIDLLFRLTRIASFFEKFKNLFIWTDPLLSLYMMMLLILVLLVVWNIQLRYIVCFSILKKFIFGIFYYKNKLINNKEIARIVVTDAFKIWQKEKAKEKSKEKEKEEKKNEPEVIKTMEKKALDDEKLKNILKIKLYEHSNIILSDDFYDTMETIGDVIEELGKVDDILKIKRLSYLFHYTKNNNKIYIKDIDPEDVFAYFIQNIKSDYYRARNGFITNDYFKTEEIIKEDMETKNINDKKLNNDISNVNIEKIIKDK